MDIDHLLASLTREEKAELVSGVDQWHTKAIQRVTIPSIMMADGPHGLRKQIAEGDHLGIGSSVRSTCFPPAATSANSWDSDLLFAMGKAIGEEALAEGVSVVLGPGVNIKRSPLCGRNFEYFSEDPYLTGMLGTSWIQGIQSVGVGASIKHFAANNQERWRMLNDSLVDERALREIYLSAFEQAIKEAKPWTVMGAYNKLNGFYCCEHPRLLGEILREEWGFSGLVVSDWGAVNDPVLSLQAGMDLEMPASYGASATKIGNALSNGQLDEGFLNNSVKRVLELVARSMEMKKDDYLYDEQEHHTLARKIAAESAVLLKNKGELLPLNSNQRVAIIGQLAKEPRYQGTGSSLINPTKLDTVLEQLQGENIAYSFAPGYVLEHDSIQEELIKEACLVAQGADVAIVFAGLTARYESEGYDRTNLDLPPSHNELIRQVVKANPRVVVILAAGAPVHMPWLNEVGAVLHSYLGGQAGAGAIVDLLFGRVNPSGKLAESYPLSLDDYLVSEFFAHNRAQTEYRESIFVGYRYYDATQKEVLFPFGYGLSYTQFQYSDLELSSKKIIKGENLRVRCTIKNIGSRAGAEIVQLYLGKEQSPLFRAPQELKGFKKVYLESGESQTVEFIVKRRALAYYNVNIGDWHVEEGEYQVRVGASSRDLPLMGTVYVETNDPAIEVPDYRKEASAYYQLTDPTIEITKEAFQAIYGSSFLVRESHCGIFHNNSTLQDLQSTWIGRIVIRGAKRYLWKMTNVQAEDDPLWKMTWSMTLEMPLRSVVALSGGTIPNYLVQCLLCLANRKYVQALKCWIYRKEEGELM